MTTPYPLGRHHEFDERSRGYNVAELLGPRRATVSSSIHRCALHLDQGNLGSCVGNGWTHARATTPHARAGLTEVDALSLYEAATKLDTIDGAYPPNDTGSSVLAGAKAAVKAGFFAGYRWAFNIDDVVNALMHLGPVVVGTNWLNDMFEPDADGFLSVSGPVEGGHCYALRGIHLNGKVGKRKPTDYITMRNSWGRTWGINSDAYIEVADMEALLKADGEAAIPNH